uniref:Uncharacterized protein n=1 Tax=Arundo donax TaxID=35708 RepID=A0A0A8YBN0_ARUDO
MLFVSNQEKSISEQSLSPRRSQTWRREDQGKRKRSQEWLLSKVQRHPNLVSFTSTCAACGVIW